MILKRKKRANTVEEYKPPMYPSFCVGGSDGIDLKIDKKSIGKTFTAKVKLTGYNERTSGSGNKKNWDFEIQSIDIK